MGIARSGSSDLRFASDRSVSMRLRRRHERRRKMARTTTTSKATPATASWPMLIGNDDEVATTMEELVADAQETRKRPEPNTVPPNAGKSTTEELIVKKKDTLREPFDTSGSNSCFCPPPATEVEFRSEMKREEHGTDEKASEVP